MYQMLLEALSLKDTFWEAISKKHNISEEGDCCGSNSLQLERIDVFYNENFTKKYGFIGKGYYIKDSELVQQVINVVRKEAELADCGTCSELGSLLFLKIREEYPDRIISTHSVLPFPKLLFLHQIVKNNDATFCIDNEALDITCFCTLRLINPG
ncbi:uncharacterized protein RHIMIDRAFT_304073 [Rhizopus microsporus ATCC 52813]|uniref:Uncharacterized protein n=1 Tax=Rhizopus microsporus ATCC 52813 TaxID=1340429 RepID=A0A2G4T0S5_RHIZD|nr:uncharacterized protein RHIMIDRAFT_304073 [Rhizopus microsporus ATCC 52813]PHZ14625.1 hypothetical protein RHIMIDRAFT_304073 [Rhizopus microsporus ATCC 52813]